MDQLLDRYSTLTEGRFHRKQKLDEDRSPRELSRVIVRAKQGDSDAIRYLYLRFADNVYGYARSIVRDDHEAEDVTQQVFTRLMGSIERYEQRSVPFSSWLLRITHNMAIDEIRRQNRRPRKAESADPVLMLANVRDERPTVEDQALLGDMREIVKDAMAQLPEAQRTALELAYFNGLTQREIAEYQDEPLGTIKTRMRLAMRKLRDILETQGLDLT